MHHELTVFVPAVGVCGGCGKGGEGREGWEEKTRLCGKVGDQKAVTNVVDGNQSVCACFCNQYVRQHNNKIIPGGSCPLLRWCICTLQIPSLRRLHRCCCCCCWAAPAHQSPTIQRLQSGSVVRMQQQQQLVMMWTMVVVRGHPFECW